MANRRLSNDYPVLCDCSVYKPCDKPVQSGLAMTPGKVRELTSKGIAVSLSAPSDTQFDGSPERGNFDIDPIFTRGMDQNTLWENSETSRRKILRSKDRMTVEKRNAKNARIKKD